MLQQDPLHAVTGPNPGTIARAEAHTGEPARGARDFPVEFPPGEAHVLMAHHERLAIAESGGGMAHRLRDGLFQQGDVSPADV